MRHESKFVLYRELGDSYRWRLRSATGETLGASGAGHREKSTCKTELRTFMADHHQIAEVLDATVRDDR